MVQKKERSAHLRPLACASLAQNESKAPVLLDVILIGLGFYWQSCRRRGSTPPEAGANLSKQKEIENWVDDFISVQRSG